jgi:hypothetical protein
MVGMAGVPMQAQSFCTKSLAVLLSPSSHEPPMIKQLPSSDVASALKLHALASVHPGVEQFSHSEKHTKAGLLFETTWLRLYPPNPSPTPQVAGTLSEPLHAFPLMNL